MSESYTLFDTDLGRVGVAWSERGITRLVLPEKDEAALRARVAGKASASEAQPPPAIAQAIARIVRHLAGEADDFAGIDLDLDGLPPFHAQVYRAALSVRSGTTTTYGELAVKMNAPGSQRAIGQALGRNPLALIVPCHRVVAANGSGGFSAAGGIATKSRMLLLEERAALGVPASRVPFDTEGAARDLAAADPELGRLIALIGPPRLRARPATSLFEALAEAIVYQQLNGKAAGTIYARLRFAVRPFDAAAVARARDAKLRSVGLSASKVLALRDLAARTLTGELPDLAALETMTDDAIRESLTRVRGIGAWTVDMLLLFRLGRPDIWPVGDFGVRKGFMLAFGRPAMPEEDELVARSERWRPHRSLVAWYLWRRTDLAAPPTSLA